MPFRAPEVALGHILDNVERATELTRDREFAEFAADWTRQYAALRCLEIISEASRSLSDDQKARQTHVPWQRVADAGNAYRHGYDNLDPRQVWQTLKEDLPILEAAVRAELARLDPAP